MRLLRQFVMKASSMSKIIKDPITGIEVVGPNWPLSSRIKAFTTTRKGGVSVGDFAGLNFGLSTADNPQDVNANRDLLYRALKIPHNSFYLTQIHSNLCVPIMPEWNHAGADASYADQVNTPSVILTADCLPVLIANRKETIVSGIHAGWRSLLMDIIENSVSMLDEDPEELFVWLGPAISQKAFEIGPEVASAFRYRNTLLHQLPKAERNPEGLFIPSVNAGKLYADIYELARLRLRNIGVPESQIYGGDLCTYSDPEYFYSYRRDGNRSGRMASFIWIDEPISS